jgi:hypothetical protein
MMNAGTSIMKATFIVPVKRCRRLPHGIERHLAEHFTTTFAIRTEKFAGGRKVIAEILDAPTDLTGRDAQNAFIVEIRDQMERFGFTSTDPLQDFWSCSFYCDVRIGQAIGRRWQSARVTAIRSIR